MYANWVRETTTTAGTGNIGTVAVPGWRRFFDVFAANDVVYYTIQDGNNRETGIGTLGGTPNTMSRTTILEKYENGVTTLNPSVGINLSGALASVYIDVPKQATFNFNRGPTLIAAALTDVWNVKGGDCFDIQGNSAVTVTSFGNPPKDGVMRFVRFVGVPITIQFGANIVMPGSQNIVTQVQDMAFLVAIGGVTMMHYCSAAALALDLPLTGGTMQGDINFNNHNVVGLSTVGFQQEYDNGNSGSAATINWANGQNQKILLNTAAPALTINVPPIVGHYQLKLRQDASGNRNPTWSGTGYGAGRWVGTGGTGAPAINTNANGYTFINFYYDGTQLFQSLGLVGV